MRAARDERDLVPGLGVMAAEKAADAAAAHDEDAHGVLLTSDARASRNALLARAVVASEARDLSSGNAGDSSLRSE